MIENYCKFVGGPVDGNRYPGVAGTDDLPLLITMKSDRPGFFHFYEWKREREVYVYLKEIDWSTLEEGA